MNGNLTPWKLLSTALAFGFLAAPLIALSVNVLVGLIVLALALSAVIYLAWNARDQVDAVRKAKLDTMIRLNGAFLVLTLLAIALIAI